MNYLNRFLPAALVITALGCALKSQPIELTSNDFDLSPLVGQWNGVYSNPETGRHGTISFTLRAGETNASGNVVMLPLDATGSPAASSNSSGQVLTIHFIRKESRNVVGTLDPYVNPDCSCKVTTTFHGTFADAKTIEGTFAITPADNSHPPTGGNWRVTRTKQL
ncbi:MAG: hypothetical protein ABR585_05280 [Gemmatimonadaceae bacterium]